ncbi:MAG: M1 family aminopeptidase [Betaproteobacteria bacterium]
MLKNIALFEFKTRVSRISTWVYFAVFFALSVLWIAAAGGLFKEANISFGSGKVFVNSPFAIAQTISLLGMFGVIVMAAVMGRAVQQDAEYRSHHFFFTSPISKLDYLGGRFIGAFGVLLVIFSSIGLGAALASLLPGMDAERLGPSSLSAYIWPYLIVLLPNSLLIGALFFTIASLTRKMLPVYIGSVLCLIGYLISLQLIRDIDNKTIAALIDPFGSSALSRITEYWTVADRNLRQIPLEGVLLWNRLLWLGIAALVATFGFMRFSFSRFAAPQVGGKARLVEDVPEEMPRAALAIAAPATIKPAGLAMLPRLTWLNLRETVKNIYFGVLVFAGVLFLIFASTTLGDVFGTSTWPVTYQMTGLLGGTFGLFMLIIIAFYAGEMVWRERDNRLDQIMDATPMPTWLPLLSKLLALMMVPVLLQILLMLCGMTIQVFKGYYNFEIGLYAKELLGIQLVDYWLLCALAIAIHSVVNQKYLGHFIMIVYYIAISFMSALGFEHELYKYGAIPPATYSDMNGFGHFLPRLFAFQAYWTAGAVLLVILAYLMWTRGTVGGWQERLQMARGRLHGGVKAGLAVGLLVFIGLGSFIFYNTNVLNHYRNSKAEQARQADYEKKYKATAKVPQPRITAVSVKTDLYPQEQRVRMSGTYRLKNKNDVPVTQVYLAFYRDDLVIHKLDFDIAAELAENDEVLQVRRYQLKTPMEPGAEATLNFDVELATHGFTNSGSNTQVVYNGSFINGRSILPAIGYEENGELSRDQDRKKFDLAPKDRMRDRDDPEGLKSNYISADADWISFETVVGTDEDQIAVAPGYLQKEWKEGGRRYFSYKMDVPILNFFAWQSARYSVKKDMWHGKANDVPIEVYYHPGHEYNLDRMIAATKASLEYFSNAFGPYQHKQFRILEFPRYASFAQAFPNTIPYSEAIGFIARVREGDEKDVDYPYYVTAHEAAHQWWAHQVMGANVQGGTMLSETLAQYSALMVMKQKYGEAKMQKFLAYEMDRYLGGRAFEQKKELPLARVENQQYIHYRKGSVVMYALQDYIGEDNVNKALKALVEECAYKGPPYPNATILLKHLRAVTPPHLQYVIDDMFENIVLYDNRTTKATYKELPGGKFEVKMSITAKKRKADKLGKEEDAPLADWIDVGVLDEKGVPIFLEKRKFEKEENEITVVVDKKPVKAGIDPLNKLIDRRPRDNAVKVELIS